MSNWRTLPKFSLILKLALLFLCSSIIIGLYISHSLHIAGAISVKTTHTSDNSVIISAALPNKTTEVAASRDFACVVTTSRSAYCSGYNNSGPFGTGNTTNTTIPVQFGSSLGKGFSQISGGSDHNCALSVEQTIYCSGSNASGQFGNGASADTTSPVQFGASLGKNFSQVSAGIFTVCGLTTDQRIYCSGSNTNGQFGNGTNTSSTTPVQFGASLGKSFSQVSTFQTFTCGLTTDQLVYCSGANASGQFGNGTNTSSTSPVQFGASLGKNFIQVSAAQSTTCVLTADQLVYCSGANDVGQFGNGTSTSSTTPVQFGASLGKSFSQVSTDKAYSTTPPTQSRYTCALTTDQLVYCAGYNSFGAFGNNTITSSSTPVVSMLLP